MFQDIEEVCEWLEPMDYIAFWDAVAPYGLTLQNRDFCDAQIASGRVPQALILGGLKGFARIELTQMFGLKHRIWLPPAAHSLRSVH